MEISLVMRTKGAVFGQLLDFFSAPLAAGHAPNGTVAYGTPHYSHRAPSVCAKNDSSDASMVGGPDSFQSKHGV